MGLTKVVPFLVEDEMLKLGAVFSKKADLAVHVVKRRLLITGQNPASSGPAAKTLMAAVRTRPRRRQPLERRRSNIHRATARFLRPRRQLAVGERFQWRLAYGTDRSIPGRSPAWQTPNGRTTQKAQIQAQSLIEPPIGRSRSTIRPLNVMGPQFVQEFREIITAEVEADDDVKVAGLRQRCRGHFPEPQRFPCRSEGSDQHAARADGIGGVAGHPCAADAHARRVDRADPRARDRERKRTFACLRHEFRQPGKIRLFAVGSGCRPGRRRRAHGAIAAAHRKRTRSGSASRAPTTSAATWRSPSAM